MFNDILQTASYSLISVISLFILTRIMGKREVSQLTFFDYIVGISIGSISASFSLDSSIGYAKGLTALIIYATFAILLSYISLKSYGGRKVLDSKPTVLIENGKIIEKALKQSKLNIDELLTQCRVKNVFDISQIELAILETSGKLSVILKPEYHPVIRKDMNITIPPKSLCINLVIDGKTLEENLKYIHQDKLWLISELNKIGVQDITNVLLAYVDSSNNLHYYLKNEPPSNLPLY